MKLDIFFEKFDLFVVTHNALAKMRELVLDLAVQGELVASTDLAAWVPVRLGDIVANGLSSVDPAASPSQLFELWSVPAFASGGPEVLTGAEIGSTKRELPDRSILLGKINPHLNRVWKVARRTTHPLIASPEWITITPTSDWNADFLARLLNSPSFNRELCSTAQGMGSLTRASTKRVAEIEIRRPPLALQKRIVAKLDELMALCDRLAAQQQQQEMRHAALARASLAHFADAPTPANLDFLFHKSYSISPADLRKSILTLAVQGKLVRQNPEDEPAAELLEIIAKQRDRLLGSALLRKSKPCRQFASDEAPHDVPETWAWTMLGEITEIGTGSTPSRTEASFWEDGTVPWITSGSTSRSPIVEGDEFVTPAAVKAHRLRVYPPGTLLVALYGQGKTRGQVALLEIPATINQACAAVCSLAGIPPMQGYLKLLLEKQYDEMRSLSAGGAQPNLNVQKIKEVFVPLPPLAEQCRIVTKVGELMALVDTLEAQLANARSAGTQLAEAVFAELTQARALA
jgi:type I restriction enzyme S subunit